MDVSLLVVYAGFALTMIPLPGPDWVYVVVSGTRDRVVVPAVAGLMIGYVAITVAVTLGVGLLVQAVPSILTAVTVAGAAYLIYLGMGILHSARAGAFQVAAGGEISRSQLFGQGLAVAVLNPKALLFYVVIVPQFATPTAIWAMPAQFAVLGAIFMLGCLLVYLPLGLLAGRVIASRPRISKVLMQVAGIIMLVLGVALAGEQALHLFV